MSQNQGKEGKSSRSRQDWETGHTISVRLKCQRSSAPVCSSEVCESLILAEARGLGEPGSFLVLGTDLDGAEVKLLS